MSPTQRNIQTSPSLFGLTNVTCLLTLDSVAVDGIAFRTVPVNHRDGAIQTSH